MHRSNIINNMAVWDPAKIMHLVSAYDHEIYFFITKKMKSNI